MNHDEAVRLLGPYRDGELDLTTCLKLEEHLAGCPSCQQKLAEEQELVGLIQSEAPRFKASPFLKTRIRAALREEKSLTIPWWKHFSSVWTYSGLAGAAVMFALLAAGVFWTQRIPALAQEAVADHVRSLQVSHLMDVASTDQHTVKPWFDGRIDFAPPVKDFAAEGFPLKGGRLDYLDGRPVAALVYQRDKHIIDLYVWPATGVTPHLAGDTAIQGYNVIHWTADGMNFWAVSDVERGQLDDFAALWRKSP